MRGLALALAPGGGARGARSCPLAAWLLERAACADGVRRGRRGGRRGQDPAGSSAPTSSAGIRWRHLLPWPAPLLAARRPATGAPPRCSHGGLEQREARRRLLDTAVFRTSSTPPVPARGPARGGEGRRGSLLCVSREDARPPRVPGPARHGAGAAAAPCSAPRELEREGEGGRREGKGEGGRRGRRCHGRAMTRHGRRPERRPELGPRCRGRGNAAPRADPAGGGAPPWRGRRRRTGAARRGRRGEAAAAWS